MDFSVLLSNSDFDDNKLHLLETLTDIVYKTSNSNDRAFANQLLGDFKLLENSWQFCDKILMKSNNMYSKFFAVSILEDLVNTKFNLLANDQKEVIRNFIIDILIKTVNSNTGGNDQLTALVNKLNIVVVAIAKSEWATTWKTFIAEICSAGKSTQELCENNVKILLMLT